MKFSTVAILATGAAAAVTPRDANDVKSVLSSVGKQVTALQQSVEGYSGGSVDDQITAGKALDSAINDGKKNIGTESLGLVDAAGLADPVNSLAAQAKKLVAALSSKKSLVQSAGSCAQVSSIVAAVYKDGNDLVGSVVALVSDVAAKPIASSLAAPLQAALSSASVDYNADNCKAGGSGGSSAGSSSKATSTAAGSSAATTEAASTGAASTGAASTAEESTPASSAAVTSAVTTPTVPGGAVTTPGTGVVPTAAAAAFAPAGALALAAAVLAL